jgi:hypothetical protein
VASHGLLEAAFELLERLVVLRQRWGLYACEQGDRRLRVVAGELHLHREGVHVRREAGAGQPCEIELLRDRGLLGSLEEMLEGPEHLDERLHGQRAHREVRHAFLLVFWLEGAS